MPAPDEIEVFVAPLNRIGAEYMITGATAAILYGQPRLTNDLDLVLALREEQIKLLAEVFPEPDFYLPPESVIVAEHARSMRGHFNILHLSSGYKADIYLTGRDPLHAWAMPLRRRISWNERTTLPVAPPEYVILRKLEYYREGGSSKHPADIRAILATSAVDREALDVWSRRLGVAELLSQIETTR
jgi:hypothetical protein